ncbi:MAG: phosphotransferase family protein, partial [Actinomycetes bacterium]
LPPGPGPRRRRHASESLVDTMAAIHAVDLRAVGLDDLGKHEGYIARQLKRWYGQWNAQKTRELPAVDQVHDELLRRIPEQGPATIVHGDYRLDNCMVNDAGDVVAVLDWEFCTLGDPLADGGLLQVYWTGPNDDPSAWNGSATTAPGFFDRATLAGEAEIQRLRVDQLVEGNAEHRAMVEQLETVYDASEPATASAAFDAALSGELPSGDDIAAAGERFLSDKGD